MNCEEAKGRWHEVFDEGASDRAADEHVRDCAECRRYVDHMTRIADMLGELHRETESVVSHRDSLERHQAPRRIVAIPFGRLGWLSAAAMVGLAVGVALYFQGAEADRPGAGRGDFQVTSDQSSDVEATKLGLSLHGVSAERYLIVARPVSEPNVQLYRLYPALRHEENEATSLEGL